MNSIFIKSAGRASLTFSLMFAAAMVHSQDPQAVSTPLDEKAQQRFARDAKKAADDEERSLRSTSERERKDAEAMARNRDKGAVRTSRSVLGPADSAPAQATGDSQDRVSKAEEKARLEAEKARKKEEDRTKAQDARNAERRRQDEERAEREAAKARDNAEKNRMAALKKEQEDADRNARRPQSAPEAATLASAAQVQGQRDLPAPTVTGSKEDERRRKDLVKQIEKSRAERDRLNKEAEEADRRARDARTAASEAQRSYEALTTGLSVEDVAVPVSPTPADAPKRNRFVTKADQRQAEASRNSPQTAADPLRIALDLKMPEAESRERAAFALASLGPDAAPATRALMAALADANASVRVAAAQALGRIGPGASMALAPLSAALTDPDPAVKNAAQAALLAIQGR
ncbi:MAG: HEAT repeat domain-containing protein [Vicinamibacteria bacterium]